MLRDASNANVISPRPDRRGSPRQRALLTGKVVYGDALYTLDCVIRNLNKEGARIKVPDPKNLPNELLLLEIRKFIAFEAEVKWRKDQFMGLEFRSHFSLDDESTLRNRQLRRIAVEAKQRLGG
jgi:hypothetical protein